jgi:hypothetical protein
MTQVFLTPEQAQVVAHALEPIQLCDPKGNVLATIQPEATAEEIAEAKRRITSPGPWYSGDQVREHIRVLQEAWEREGGFDKTRMLELLQQVRATEKK